jgi:hypothetical protein
VRKVLCSICKSQFSIEHGGRCDVLQRIKKRKHAIAVDTKSYSKKVTAHFTKETITDECSKLQPKEDCLHSTQDNTTIPFDP